MLTVLIATRNGEHIIPNVLEAYCQLEAPRGGWKLVVVDNGSTDQTTACVGAFKDRLPLTLIVIRSPGKCAALNTGLEAVSGDLVVLTDDDTFPRPDWLVRLREAADANPNFALFGGRIEPRWEVTPPAWILTTVPLGSMFAITSPDMPEGSVAANAMWGGNMAVRTEIFRAGYRFDTSIGPRGEHYSSGEDTDFIERLMKAGHRAWYCPSAIVEHFIRSFQLERSWMLDRAARIGRAVYRRTYRNTSPAARTWFGTPTHLVRTFARHVGELVVALPSRNVAKRFRARWEMHFDLGRIAEARLIHREGDRAVLPEGGSRSDWTPENA